MKRYNALMEVLRTGEFDARSALGNRMRQLYPDKKLNQMPPEEAEKWKREFVNLELKPLCVVKTETQSWSRADLTSAEYEPFGAIVVRLGGRDDPEAVQGAIVGTSKCLLMGPPWWRRHPQTEMIEVIILRTSWQEAFKKEWARTKTTLEYGQAPQALGNGALALQDAAPPARDAAGSSEPPPKVETPAQKKARVEKEANDKKDAALKLKQAQALKAQKAPATNT